MAKTIDVEGISEGTILAAIEFPSEGLQAIENPTTKILDEYFGEYSIVSKAYWMQGGENLLFRETAKVLLEYGFVHLRPLTMPKNRTDFIIATFEGLRVDWPLITANSLRKANATIVDGKKAWAKISQWLTILAPPEMTVNQQRR